VYARGRKCRLAADDGAASASDHRGMPLNPLIAATTSWPDAAIAIAGIALVGSVVVIVVWQALATWRARITTGRQEEYRALAQQTARDLHAIAERLGIEASASDRTQGGS
jgi:hypothetical protein